MNKMAFIVLLFCSIFSFGQEPLTFKYNDLNGLPSNEVYSIAQDKKGFIWIGCDIGLYKYDGIRFTLFTSKTQTAKSCTGLVFSSSQKLYCYNFKSQLFCLDNGVLTEIKNDFYKITNLASDSKGNIYIAHTDGISVYNENQKTWKNYLEKTNDLAYSVIVDQNNDAFFIHKNGIKTLTKNKTSFIIKTNFNQPNNFVCEKNGDQIYVFSLNTSQCFFAQNKEFIELKNTKLTNLLKERKIINVKNLNDGNLWIFTFNGIVRYNLESKNADLFFENNTISNCLLDREGNYWFTSTQAGIFRVPNFDLIVWNTGINSESKGFNRLETDGKHIYFATANAEIGKIDLEKAELSVIKKFKLNNLQSFDFSNNNLWFNVDNKELFMLENEKIISHSYRNTPPIKTLIHVEKDIIWGTSFGIFINQNQLTTDWTREFFYDSKYKKLWATTNSGLQLHSKINGKWKNVYSFFNDIQQISMSYDSIKKDLYSISFDGKINKIDVKNNVSFINQLPYDVQAFKMVFYEDKIYIATNKGVWILNLITNNWEQINTISKLVSNNVKDILILNDNLWVATSSGLQQISINDKTTSKSKGIIYLKNIASTTKELILKYKESLELIPEMSHYNSNGNFQFAYRILENGKDWIVFPGNIYKITIPSFNSGYSTLEIKGIDNLGNDTQNVINLQIYTDSPFWRKWWFIGFVLLSIIGIVFLIIRLAIKTVRKKEINKTALVQSQLKAIRAQMNPHFLYNTLNSIQDLILSKDIKNTNYYLSKFSTLMRQILAFSEEESVLLSEEIEMLNNYLELEKLRFGDDFMFEFNIDKELKINHINIPSLVLQPFVENAIKHGLLHKKGLKLLKIEFVKKQNHLHIYIEDNGVGRRHSQQIKVRNNHLHKSFSSNAVQMRIDLLNTIGNQKIDIEIIDIEKNDVTGTKVHLILELH
jgi:ligand-binding sensor domain-containing protein